MGCLAFLNRTKAVPVSDSHASRCDIDILRRCPAGDNATAITSKLEGAALVHGADDPYPATASESTEAQSNSCLESEVSSGVNCGADVTADESLGHVSSTIDQCSSDGIAAAALPIPRLYGSNKADAC